MLPSGSAKYAPWRSHKPEWFLFLPILYGLGICLTVKVGGLGFSYLQRPPSSLWLPSSFGKVVVEEKSWIHSVEFSSPSKLYSSHPIATFRWYPDSFWNASVVEWGKPGICCYGSRKHVYTPFKPVHRDHWLGRNRKYLSTEVPSRSILDVQR